MSEGASAPGLKRVLGETDAAWLVAGSMIGSGIFITPGLVAGSLPGMAWTLSAWLLGGLVALMGAAVYGELGARLPRAGGEYQYLTHAYGPMWGFMSGWAALTLTFSAAAAAQSRAALGYLWAALPGSGQPPAIVDALVAPLVVLALTWANTVGARVAGRTTLLFTAVPLAVLVGMFGYGALTGSAELALPEGPAAPPDSPWLVAFAAAMIPIFFTYSGWNAAAYLAGEMRDPRRGLARGLLLGTGLVTLLYLLINLVLMMVLPQSELASSTRPVADAARLLLGGRGDRLLSLTISIAILGSANVTLMAGARIYYAMAVDGMAPSTFTRINRAGVPSSALWVGGVWSAGLAMVGRIQDLVSWATLAILLLSSLTVTALFVLRRRGGQAPFRCPGYPVTPALFLLISLYVAWKSFWYDWIHALIGVAIIAAGFPIYLFVRRFKTFVPLSPNW